MKRTRFLSLVALFVAVLILDLAAPLGWAQQKVAKQKIVFIAGSPSHAPGEHEHRAGSMLLADQLNRSGLPIDSVVSYYGWPEDERIFKRAAAVVMYADGGGRHPAIGHLDTLRKLAEQGVGIGALHYAVEVPEGKPGEAFLDVIGGYFEVDWSVNPHWDADFNMVDHPVTRGIEDFKIRDEWYYHMRFRKDMEGITPILSALPPEETLSRPDGPHSGNPHVREAVLKRKEPQHVLWLYERPEEIGGGRAFGFTGGHFHKNWQHDDHRGVVLNAIVWIAGMEVPEGGVPSPTPSDEELQANLDDKPVRK